MTLSRQVVVPGMIDQYREFADLIRELSPVEWNAPTRCTDWIVADVSAHVTGQLADIAGLRLEGIGTPEVTRRQVEERKGRSADELAAELEANTEFIDEFARALDDGVWAAPAPGGLAGTLGFGFEALLYDTSIHADDVRVAVGRPSSPGDALLPSLSHVADVLSDQGWGPADLNFEGVGHFAVSGGGGMQVTCDAFAFLLAASGRSDPGRLGIDASVNIYRD